MQVADDTFDNNFFTTYLDETKDRIEGEFTASKWLKMLDLDSLEMLDSCIDNFDESITPIEDVDDDEAADMVQLVTQIVKIESDIPEWSNEFDLEGTIQSFTALVAFEKLRRKGLIEIRGDGKLTGKSTHFELSEDAKALNLNVNLN